MGFNIHKYLAQQAAEQLAALASTAPPTPTTTPEYTYTPEPVDPAYARSTFTTPTPYEPNVTRQLYHPHALDKLKPTDPKSKTYQADLDYWQKLQDQSAYQAPQMVRASNLGTLADYENYYNSAQGVRTPYENSALSAVAPRLDDPASVYTWYAQPKTMPSVSSSKRSAYSLPDITMIDPYFDPFTGMFSPDSFATGGITDSLQYIKREG